MKARFLPVMVLSLAGVALSAHAEPAAKMAERLFNALEKQRREQAQPAFV